MPNETQVVITGIIVTTVIGFLTWSLHRILIEPLDENTKAVRKMADEFRIFNEGRTDIVKKIETLSNDVEKCQGDIDKCNEKIATLSEALKTSDVIL